MASNFLKFAKLESFARDRHAGSGWGTAAPLFLSFTEPSVSENGGAMSETTNNETANNEWLNNRTQNNRRQNGKAEPDRAGLDKAGLDKAGNAIQVDLDEIEDDPEDHRIDNAVIERMVNKADRIIARNLLKIVTCIGNNVIDKNHAPSVRVLFEIAGRMRTNQPITPEEYASFAEILWGELDESTEQ